VQQHTLLNSARIAGIGLHSAAPVQLVLHPAEPNTGIVFRRSDCVPAVDIRASLDNVSDSRRATTLALSTFSPGSVAVATVEHLLAALVGMGVDNALVELDSAEVPIVDGSAEPFLRLIRSTGLAAQPSLRRFLRVKEEVCVSDGDKSACFSPHEGFRILFTVDFDHPVFQRRASSVEMVYSPQNFEQTVGRARTFGFLHELDSLQARGLALGGSVENAVVLDETGILNEEGLRCDDELVQHKVLDAMGDLALARYPIIGEYRAVKAGHTLNHRALKALLARPSAWEIVTFEDAADVPPGYGDPLLRG